MRKSIMGKLKNQTLHIFLLLFIIVIITRIESTQDNEIILKNNLWAIQINLSSLEVKAKPKEHSEFPISIAQANLGPVQQLKQEESKAEWEFPEKGITAIIELQGTNLSVRIRSKEPQEFIWPIIQDTGKLKALIWPRWEGCYIPLDDKQWTDYLIESGEWNTLEGIGMPFGGLDCGDYILTYIITNPYNNEIRFNKTSEKLEARFTHNFPPNNAEREYGFLICLGENYSPIEPAKRFRSWLIEQGKFVTLKEKMKKIPKVERLLGAPHIYLWGDQILTRYDIYRKQWKPFCQRLIEQSAADKPSPGKRIKELMNQEQWNNVIEITKIDWPYDYIKREVTDELSRLLELPDFYDEASWKDVSLPDKAIDLVQRKRETLSLPELCRMNSLLLKAAYPDFMEEVDNWGDGVSVKMLKQIKEAGFDRMQFCLDGWSGVEKRPEVALIADQMGYLFGTYDSFHSIHDPALKGTDATWSTAQFDKELYETGAIVRKDGEKRGGFKKQGYKLSPIAARPYVEKRVNENMKKVPYNYYFVDCDAFGEVYDDYSPLHPATQAEDVRARNDRLAWIRDTYKVVIGSEGGSSYAAPVIHIAEGMFGPGFGWGDSDLKDKTSEYYLGSYFPPDGPAIFLKQVPLKEKYQYLYYDPRFRLPLYEIVFHDSVVTTNHWGNSSLKFKTVLDTVALTELLYQVPPLYHLNIDEFKKHKETIRKHYDFFSPLHRELGFSQMTDFAWLTPNRLVQRTVFDDKVEMVANFTEQPFKYQEIVIPSRGILTKERGSGKTKIFTPSP